MKSGGLSMSASDLATFTRSEKKQFDFIPVAHGKGVDTLGIRTHTESVP